MKTKGYSIWFIPDGKTFKILSKVISNLSKKYSSPFFDPHITLLGGIEKSEDEVIEKTQKLALKIKPFEIKLLGINFSDDFLKALFLEVKSTKAIMTANKLSQEIFKVDELYQPHLSLIYGNFPEKVKKDMIKRLNNKIVDLTFVVDKVYLYGVEGEIKDWKKIAEFQLAH